MRRAVVAILVALIVALPLRAQTTKRAPKLPPAPAGVSIQQDVTYLEPNRSEKLDLYLPSDRAKDVRSPGIVLIHGGGWVGGDKASGREFEIGTTLAKAGYVVASVNYTLERGNWPGNLFDCKNAVRFLRKNSDAYQVDVKNIGVIGGSAGGHLALMVAYTTDATDLEPKAPYPDVSDAVNCVVDMYGITDLLTRSKTDEKGNAIGTPGDKAAAMLTEPREGHEDLWKSASPVTYVSKKTVPTLILHGTADTTVNRDQATELYAKLKEAGVEHEIHMIPGIGHTFDFETWNHKPLPQDLRPVAIKFFDSHLKRPYVQWDQHSLRYIGPGGYARMVRVSDGSVLLTCEEDKRVAARFSHDEGKSWSDPVEAARTPHGTAANPQPLQLKSGTLLLFFNERPTDNKSHFTICVTTSRDGGKTWKPASAPIYSADIEWSNGCWEPAAVQLPTGEILLFFANESPYRKTDEQEISVMRSHDDGATWSEAKTFSFKQGGRDGMPSPLVLKNGQVVVAIEQSIDSFVLQPAILRYDTANVEVISGNDSRRTPAMRFLRPDWYAGAPFLAQVSTGETLLSCQTGLARGEAGPTPALFIGDANAAQFLPGYPPLDPRGLWRFAPSFERSAWWNSLFVRRNDTIIRLMSANIDKKSGVWAIDGRISNPFGVGAQ